jgi:hypothetical protein
MKVRAFSANTAAMACETSSVPAASRSDVGAIAAALAASIVDPMPPKSAAAAVRDSGAATRKDITDSQFLTTAGIAAVGIKSLLGRA